jgi:signal transduction histidine kinase
MGRFRDFHPSIAIVNFDMPGGQELIDSIMSENPAVQIIVLCKARSLDLAMGGLKNSTADFLLRPVQPVALDMALRRAENVLSLQARLEQTMDNLSILSAKRAAEMVDTERFLAIRQIVDRMSAFIGQVANDVQFDVIDTGSGMNENQIKNMFTMFYTTKGSKGTGLGLFIANKTVRKHGGRITVDSLPGLGTTFYIRLPRRVPSAA